MRKYVGGMSITHENMRLRERITELEADKARLVAVLTKTIRTLELWEPEPQPTLAGARAELNAMKGGSDER